MTQRPAFLTVTYSESGLSTMNYERKLVREDDVKFDGEDGILELTDVRLVWYKKPKKRKKGLFGGLKKIGAVAGAIAGGAILDSIGHEVGGIGGAALRGIGRGLAYGAVGAAISSWTADQFYNRASDGSMESLALPVVAISNVAQSGNELVVELKSGGHMTFEFKQKKVIPSIIANLKTAQDEGKCPYCGHVVGNAATCSNCGAPLGGSGGSASTESRAVSRQPSAPATSPPATGSVHISVADEGGDVRRATIVADEGGNVRRATINADGTTYHISVKEEGGYCPNCGNAIPAGSKFCNNCGYRLR